MTQHFGRGLSHDKLLNGACCGNSEGLQNKQSNVSKLQHIQEHHLRIIVTNRVVLVNLTRFVELRVYIFSYIFPHIRGAHHQVFFGIVGEDTGYHGGSHLVKSEHRHRNKT